MISKTKESTNNFDSIKVQMTEAEAIKIENYII